MAIPDFEHKEELIPLLNSRSKKYIVIKKRKFLAFSIKESHNRWTLFNPTKLESACCEIKKSDLFIYNCDPVFVLKPFQ